MIVPGSPKRQRGGSNFSSGGLFMRKKINENDHNSSQFITFLADFGIPIPDSALPEPAMTIVSDFGNGTVS
jgi:hypothetical protein